MIGPPAACKSETPRAASLTLGAERTAGGQGFEDLGWIGPRTVRKAPWTVSLTRGAKRTAGVPGAGGAQGAKDALVDARGTEAQRGRDGARSARTHLMVAQGRGTRRYNTLVIVPWHYGQRENACTQRRKRPQHTRLSGPKPTRVAGRGIEEPTSSEPNY